MALCISCGHDKLGAVREPVTIGTPVFCSDCGALMVADYVPLGPELEIPGVRLPSALEAEELRADPDVVRWRDAWILSEVDRAGNLKEKERTDGPALLEELERARRR